MILLNLLVSQNIISELEARVIEDESKKSSVPIDEIFIEHNIANTTILTARNAVYNIPIWNGSHDLADSKLYGLLDKEKSERYLVVPLDFKKDEIDFISGEVKGESIETLKIKQQSDSDFIENKYIKEEVSLGMVDPERNNVLDALQFIMSNVGVSYKVYLISLNEFKRRFAGYKKDGINILPNYSHKTNTTEMAQEIIDDITDEDDVIAESLLDSIPIKKLINVFLKKALTNNASDIHIENLGEYVRVRVRVDGILQTFMNFPAQMHAAVIARIKILCNLRLDEKRKPQDGRFSVKYQGHKVDFRVATFPGYYGEKAIIRILDSFRGVKKLEDIGFSERHLSQIRNALAKPFGMVLIAGPTGSGKTTTLYSMLNEIDRDKRNVVSLEDPIEYNIPNMNQSQIFPEIGYTFATGLRSILRGDPDVIMVGEIRDAETAALAIQAALTGHLVFSTIHTNGSIGVINRLIDMGIEPFLIAPTINLAISQRLVHRILPGATEEIKDPGITKLITDSFKDLGEEYKKELPLDKNPNNAKPIFNSPSGLKGRIPVVEILEIDKEIENIIMRRGSEEDIWKAARNKGMINMKEDAIIKSIKGLVPFIDVHGL